MAKPTLRVVVERNPEPADLEAFADAYARVVKRLAAAGHGVDQRDERSVQEGAGTFGVTGELLKSDKRQGK